MFGPNSSQKEGKVCKRDILHLGDMNQILVLKATKTKLLEKVAIKIVNITNQKELLEVNNAIYCMEIIHHHQFIYYLL